MVYQSCDTERLKHDHDCRNIAQNMLGAPVTRSGRAWQWNCPFHEDHATPSFTVYSNGYYCFGCGASGDQISLVMALEQIRFVDAVEYLAGQTHVEQPRQPIRQQRADGQAMWREPWWQKGAHRIVAGGTQRLPGSPGAEYLAGRGIALETCQAFALGYTPHVQLWVQQGQEWVPADDLGAAIIIPWQANGVVQAVQYRLIEHQMRRFHQKYGGERVLFGVDQLAQRDVLVVVEGELNAISIWQAAGNLVDVVSFGPESNIEKAAPAIGELCSGYQHVITWADKPARALDASTATRCGGTPLQSPVGLDANDLLRRGQLGGFLAKILDRVRPVSPAERNQMDADITVIHPADAHCATVHGKWRRLEDGRIEAHYSRAELIWAKIAVGYEPTADELALAAQL